MYVYAYTLQKHKNTENASHANVTIKSPRDIVSMFVIIIHTYKNNSF